MNIVMQLMSNQNTLIDDIVSLCKRRGFVFQSSEIYGGYNGFFDYGPLGVELAEILKMPGGMIWFVAEMIWLV